MTLMGMGILLRGSVVALAALTVGTVTACSSPSTYSSGESDYLAEASVTCADMLDAAVANERAESGAIDSTMQSLSERCSNEYDIAVDYLSNAGNSSFGIDSCDELLGYGARQEAVQLLEEDGYCSDGVAEALATPEWPEGGLGWDAAGAHAGSVQRVCGPLMSVRETADGTFVNIGRDYPSADRFTFIFWDVYLEAIQPGATICGSGEIYLYDGVVAQMEMWDPAALEIWQ